MKASVKNAIMIGTMCSVSYLAVYITRNVLGVVSPEMIEEGVFTTEQIGSLSSVYFATYAVGQLINGVIGEKIKSKYMISVGLVMAGLCNFLFSVLSDNWYVAYIAYGMTGFFLSMIYAPMTKTVAENTEPIYATRCSLGYTFSSFFGSPLAGVLAVLFAWRGAFGASSVALWIMGVLSFIFFSVLERKGIVKYNQYKKVKEKGGGIRVLIQHRIIKFTMISIITGIVRTTVVFWLPTYFAQYLGFSSENTSFIYMIATFLISMTTFVAVFLYEKLKRNMDLTILVSFISASVSFLLVGLIKNPICNIILIIVAVMSSNCAAAMLWSRYCPSLRDTGMVSSVTGFLDCVSYMAAAVSSTLFANAVSAIGWGNLILVWFGLMILGVIVSLPRKEKKNLKLCRIF